MNQVNLLGNIVADIELNQTQNGKSNIRFNLAVRRDKENTDFIRCAAWNKTAEIMSEHLKKGDKIGITGNIKTGNYEKDGVKRYTTDIWIEKFYFVGVGKKKDDSIESMGEVVESDDLSDGFPF